MYGDDRQHEVFFGLSATEVRNALASNEIVWAPDGDAAFDDGGHVLQFDQGDMVRLIAFKNVGGIDEIAQTLAEAWVTADEFYGLLGRWQSGFEAEWATALRNATKH